MLQKHILDNRSWPVPVQDYDLIGPCKCPQTGCQSTDGSGPYQRGRVIFEEYGGNSGDYITSLPCKCCDSNGFLGEGKRPYQNYCFSVHARDIRTGYPSPYPMPRALYDDPELLENIKLFSKRPPEKAESSTCYIATAVYGSSDAREVRVLRQFRDEALLTSRLGSAFVRLYYAVSPSLAKRLKPFSSTSAAIRSILNLFVAFLHQREKTK